MFAVNFCTSCFISRGNSIGKKVIRLNWEKVIYRLLFMLANTLVSIQKAVYKQKRLVQCNLHQLFVALKERNSDVKIGFSKFSTVCPKQYVIAGSSGTHLVCVCTTHQNTILLVDTLNLEVKYKDLVNKVVCDPPNHEYMIHNCTNCPGTRALCKFLEEELGDIDLNFQFHYSQW